MAERKRKESGSASARERTGTPARRRAPARAKSAAATTEAAAPAINESGDAAISQASKPSDITPELTPFDPVAEREEIARLAYAYYEARGGKGGSAEEDWFRAEQELRRRRAAL
ncbi:MAG: DUF2934 domain-containing protein [bacterium]|jgi:hypothetical protein